MILQQVLHDYTHSYVVHTYVNYKYMPDIPVYWQRNCIYFYRTAHDNSSFLFLLIFHRINFFNCWYIFVGLRYRVLNFIRIIFEKFYIKNTQTIYWSKMCCNWIEGVKSFFIDMPSLLYQHWEIPRFLHRFIMRKSDIFFY